MKRLDWDAKFEALIRAHLRFLPADHPLPHDTDLTVLGIDSMGMIELFIELEVCFDVDILGGPIALEGLTTPGRLRDAIIAAGAPPGDV